jgi:uncharacterized membrane protein YdjX (TVP38/TMEM64 family)
MTPNDAPAPKPTPLAIRLWPLYVIAGGIFAAWAFGLFDYLSLETLRTQQDALRGFVSEHLVLAVAAYILTYAAATLFMVPGALWITIAGGFLFGLIGGTPATIIGATLGASLLFFAARTMERGFQEDAFSYMFALRFLPIVPFPVANIAPAILGAKYRDYAITTALGIIPGVLAYTWIGAGLGATFAAGEDPNIVSIAKNMVPAFAALGVVSLLPVAYKKLFSKKAAKLEGAS